MVFWCKFKLLWSLEIFFYLNWCYSHFKMDQWVSLYVSSAWYFLQSKGLGFKPEEVGTFLWMEFLKVKQPHFCCNKITPLSLHHFWQRIHFLLKIYLKKVNSLMLEPLITKPPISSSLTLWAKAPIEVNSSWGR